MSNPRAEVAKLFTEADAFLAKQGVMDAHSCLILTIALGRIISRTALERSGRPGMQYAKDATEGYRLAALTIQETIILSQREAVNMLRDPELGQ